MTKKFLPKTPTVSVAVSAYNEEQNIAPFLKSILKQKQDGFMLEKILVISDGSTDQTVKIARSFTSPLIEVRDYKTRSGKSTHLNEIYATLSSGILVQTDADVVFDHPLVVKDMIQPFLNDERVGMCGGYPLPADPTTFTERAVYQTFAAYEPLRHLLRGGHNMYSVDGRILAFSNTLAKKITVPTDMITNDIFTYFSCLHLGYDYRFVPSAVVWYRLPQTVRDQVKQNTRYLAARSRMLRYFPEALIKKECYVPLRLLRALMFKQFIKHPVFSVFIYLLNRYCKLKAAVMEQRLTAIWEIADSTKALK